MGQDYVKWCGTVWVAPAGTPLTIPMEAPWRPLGGPVELEEDE